MCRVRWAGSLGMWDVGWWDDTHEQKLTLTGRFGSGEHRGKWVFGHLAIVVAFHAQSPAKFRCSSKHWPLNVETLYVLRTTRVQSPPRLRKGRPAFDTERARNTYGLAGRSVPENRR